MGKHGYEAEIEAIGALKVLLLMLIYYLFLSLLSGFVFRLFLIVSILYFFFCCVHNSGQSIAEDAQLYKRVLMDRVAMDV